MTTRRWTRVGLVGVCFAVLGGAERLPPPAATASTPGASRADTVVVEATDGLEFRPDSIRIRVGQVVRWRNVGVVRHSATAEPSEATLEGSVHLPDGAEPFNSGLLDHGETFSHSFQAPGRYGYFCIPHEGAGMTGTVIVTE